MFTFYLAIFLIGLSLGSFSSVIIYRLHQREKGIIKGRSKCPHCQKKLGVRDLIPLISYMANGGRCRQCHHKISAIYPLLEISMGSLFLLTSYLVDLNNPLLLVYFLFLTFIFVLLSAYDILFQEVPDEISLPTIAVAGVCSYFLGLYDGQSLIIGFLVPVLFFGGLFGFSRGRWLGGGDIRIGGIMGLALGWPNILVGLFASYLIGALFSLIGILTKKLTRKSMIPFGPFLFSGTYITLFWGREIMDWYLKWI